MKTFFSRFLLLAILLRLNNAKIASISMFMDSVSYPRGSIYGGTQLFIKGSGFDIVNFQNQIFINNIECPVVNYYTSEYLLSCVLPFGQYNTVDQLKALQKDPYSITVLTNGVKHECINCSMQHFLEVSPAISSIIPNSIYSGQSVKLLGFLKITTQKMDYITFGEGYHCEVPEEEVAKNQWNYLEHLECKLDEIPAGLHDLNVRVGDNTGFALVTRSAKGFDINTQKLYALKVYPVITKISSNEIFQSGGRLEVEGTGFGIDKSLLTIELQFQNSQFYTYSILEISDTHLSLAINKIEGTIVAESSDKVFLGGQGLSQRFIPTTLDLTKYQATAGYPAHADEVVSIKLTLDSYEQKENYILRYSGAFKTVEAGKYKFWMASDDQSILKLQKIDFKTPLAESSVQFQCSYSSYTPFKRFFQFQSDLDQCEFTLEANTYYHMIVLMKEFTGSDWLNIALTMPYSGGASRSDLQPQITQVTIQNNLIPEVIQVVSMNATGGTFSMLFQEMNDTGQLTYDKNIELIPFNASANEMRTRIINKTRWNITVERSFLDSQKQVIYDEQFAKGFRWVISFVTPRTQTMSPFMVSNLTGTGTSLTATVTNPPSPKLSGSFKLKIDGEITNSIPFNAGWEKIFNEIRLLQKFRDQGISVSVHGNDNTGRTWNIIFDGQHEVPVEVVESTLTGGDPQFPPKVVLYHLAKNPSNLFHNSVPSQLLRTVNASPQLNIKVKEDYVVCQHQNCKVQTLPLSVVPSLASQTMNAAGLLTIQLTAGYEALGHTITSSNVRVYLGWQECGSVSVSLPAITCQVPIDSDTQLIASAGSWKPKVELLNKGFLQEGTVTNVEFNLVVSTVAPLLGSTSGSQKVTITGKRFDNSVEVRIGANLCVIQSQSYTKIVCVTAATSAGLVNVVVTQNGKTVTHGTQYEFRQNITPTVGSISPLTANPVLRTDLTIAGTNFIQDNTEIFLEKVDDASVVQKCYILSLTETQIICKLGGGVTGSYRVKVVTNNGSSLESISFKYESTITGISRTSGSPQGGSLITITGTNFSPDRLDQQVGIGDFRESYFCDILSATATQLVCKTKPINLETIWYNVNAPLFVKLKLSEDAVCKTTCVFKFSAAHEFAITAINKAEFVSGENIVLTYDKTLSAGDTMKMLIKNTETEQEVTSSSISGKIATFPMPGLKVGTYTISVNSLLNGDSKFMITNSLKSTLKITSISPIQSYGGGILATIQGNGFYQGLSFFVKSQSNPCLKVVFVSSTEVKCLTGDYAANQTNLSVLARHLNQNTICTGCSFAITADAYQNTAISKTSTTDSENVQFDVTFSSTTPMNQINEVSLFNRVTKEEILGTFTTAGQVANLTFASVPIGEYKVLVKAPLGFYKVSQFFSVLNNAASNSFPVITSSFLGGSQGTFNVGKTAQDPVVEVCGFQAKIVSKVGNVYTYETPAFLNVATVDQYKMFQAVKIAPKEVIVKNISFKERLTDGDLSLNPTFVESCNFVYDFGEGYQVYLSQVKLFPFLNTNIQMSDAVLEGSNDNVTYATLHSYLTEFQENWREVSFAGSQLYRYVRFSAIKCQVAEFEVHGVKVKNQVINLTSHKCELKLTSGTASITQADVVEYRQDSTPVITSISPSYISSLGGNLIVEGNITDSCTLTLDQTSSTVSTTGGIRTYAVGARGNIVAHSLEIMCPNGRAALMGNDALFADRWSENATWGGDFLPVEGESVHIPKGQTLLVDISPPKMKLVMVEGKLLFEDKDINFDAHYIIVREGEMRAGYEDAPFENKLTITLHGDKYDRTLPGMGNKLIGVVNGELYLFGAKRTPTWTSLQTTAAPNDATITLTQAVNWKVGDKIVISTTGLNKDEFEVRYIQAINANKTILTLDEPLKHNHYAGQLTRDGATHQLRAKVAVFSRQIVVQGDQTTDKTQHGVHVMLRGASGKVKGQISQVEVRKCGQLFNMGRYPLHFHMIGNVNGSYIDGVSVFNSFNRGTTVHGVHYLQIKNSVYYEHFGHGIFIEDSVESLNTIENNLIMKTKKATSLLESDLHPAAMWITRPNNFIRNNVAIGSSHFGIWFDLPGKPTGPSANVKNVCPVGDQLGAFEGNESHGNGIGMRVYPQYLPRTHQCSPLLNTKKLNPFEDNPANRQIFQRTLLWNNNQGFFNKKGGTFTLNGFTFISNKSAVSFGEPQYQIYSAMTSVTNSTIIGTSDAGNLHDIKTLTAISVGKKEGVVFQNIKVHDFTDGVFLNVCKECDPKMGNVSKGMHVTHLENFAFTNAVFSKKIQFTEPEFGMDLVFDDGTIMGQGQVTISPYFKHLDGSGCTLISDVTKCSHPCLVCPRAKGLKRLELQNLQTNLKGLNLKVFNMDQGGFATDLVGDDQFSVIRYRQDDEMPGFQGWSFPVMNEKTYNLHFSNGQEISQIQIQNNYYWSDTDKVRLNFNITSTPELFEVALTGFNDNTYVENLMLESDATLTQGSKFAVFSWNASEKVNRALKIGVSGSQKGAIKVSKVQCKFQCPLNPGQEEPEDFNRTWSNPQSWPSGSLPIAGDNVTIESTWNMIFDLEESPILNTLTINGRLIIENVKSSYILKAKRVYISRYGTFRVGDEGSVYTKKFQLILFGKKDDEQTVLSPLIEPTNKSIVNIGLLYVNSASPTTQFTKLAKNAKINDTMVTLAKEVDWQVGDEIAISSTSQNEKQYEKVSITEINSNVLTVSPALKYNHYGYGTVTTTQGTLDMRAEVIHLTRNVKIVGDSEGNWGCTVQTVGYRETNSTQFLQGQATLKGVEIKNCGQYNQSFGALHFINLFIDGKPNTLENSVIRDCLGVALTGSSSINLNFLQNNIFDAQKVGVYLEDVSKGQFIGNVVMGVKKREDYTNVQVLDLLNGFEYHSDRFLEQNEFFIKNNIISSAPWFAWVVPGHSCTTTTPNFSDNVGHSSMAGWFGNRVNADCQRYSNFIGYKNSEQGLVNRFMIHKLKVENCLFSDNGNSLALNGGAITEKDFPTSEIKNTVIIGQAQENCDFCYDNEKDCRTNGVITSLFEKNDFKMDFSEYKLPLHNATFTSFLWGGLQTLDSVIFQNFNKDKAFCADSDIFAIRTNQFTQDTSVHLKMTGVTVQNVDEQSKFFFYNHTRTKHSDFCSRRDCTGIYNILIDDVNGAFSTDGPKQYFGYNKRLNDGNCTFVEEWNGHRCKSVYQLLSIKKTDRERNPIISPISTSISRFAYEGSEFLSFLNNVDNQDMFPMIVKINSIHKIQFSQSQKNNNIYRLDSNDPNNWAVFSIQNEDPAIMIPYVNGKMKTAMTIENNAEVDWTKYTKQCGANVFSEATKTLTWIMNGSSNCNVTIRIKNALFVAMVFEMDISQYYEVGGNAYFIDKIANTLGIHPSNITIVGVRKGSTHVDFVITSDKQEELTEMTESVAVQVQQIQQLDSLKQLLEDQKVAIAESFNTKITSFDQNLVVAPQENFTKFCRFYSYDEAIFLATIEEKARIVESGREYRDFNCATCTQKPDCFASLKTVCEQHKEFLGVKCQENVVTQGPGETGEVTNPDKVEPTKKVVDIAGVVSVLLMLIMN